MAAGADADTGPVTIRTWITVALLAGAALAGWKLVAPSAERATDAAGAGVESGIDLANRGFFTAAEASLAAHRSTTGTYVGARLVPPARLVRADATSYCIELDRPPQVAHLVGPGGRPAPGSC